MYTKAVRTQLISSYSCIKSLAPRIMRWQYAHEAIKPVVVNRYPGAAHQATADIAVPALSFDSSNQVITITNASSLLPLNCKDHPSFR